MIDVDTKYIDEAMDFVFKQTKTHNTTTSSIVRNHGIPETLPKSKFVYTVPSLNNGTGPKSLTLLLLWFLSADYNILYP